MPAPEPRAYDEECDADGEWQAPPALAGERALRARDGESHGYGDQQRERDPERAEADGGREVAVGALGPDALFRRGHGLYERSPPVVRGDRGSDQQHGERLRHWVEVVHG